MDFSSLSQFLVIILQVIIVIYVIGVIGFILLDNRTPQSTFAWMFLMLTFPILGFLIYIFLGEIIKPSVTRPNWRASAVYLHFMRR